MSVSRSAIVFAAMLDLDHEYDEAAELNVADQAIVAHAVDPEPGPVRRQRLAHVGRVGEAFDYSELGEDSSGGWFIELA